MFLKFVDNLITIDKFINIKLMEIVLLTLCLFVKNSESMDLKIFHIKIATVLWKLVAFCIIFYKWLSGFAI